MKILFHNYANSLSSEPLYLHTALFKCGVDSQLWSDNNVSAYDVFDIAKPDIFVTHFRMFTNDIMSYLRDNNKCEIVMNVTGATQAQINSIEEAFKLANIKCPLLFTNSFDNKLTSKLNLTTMYPAADIFNMSYGPVFNVGLVEEAILSNKFDENLKNYIGKKEVYHLLYITETESEIDNHFDIRVNVSNLPQLYKTYSTITMVGDNNLCCSQIFFDMVLNSKNTQIRSSDVNGFTKMLESVFKEEHGDGNVDIEMKKQIKSNHTPFHRAWRLMKYLGNKDAMSKIDNIKSQVPGMLKDI